MPRKSVSYPVPGFRS